MFSKESTLNSEESPNLEKSSECYGPSFSSSNLWGPKKAEDALKGPGAPKSLKLVIRSRFQWVGVE